MTVEIDVLVEDDRWQECAIEALAIGAMEATLAEIDLTGAHEIVLLACDDARIAALNTAFREKPQPTNVLSWPYMDLSAEKDGALPDTPATVELGDIALAFETCRREADEQQKPFDHHVTHLIVHGTLHLLGFDHIRDKDATLMEGLETTILGKMGLPDPYREDSGV